ncbi:hypothetical protein BJ741DRAFT_373971 [Chytriomyces cf. hyalinus JEL632]|nr:hypothetical protein BJ741DRAFT_373971 [Chytriomyces cf. hyalinus JEL632]
MDTTAALHHAYTDQLSSIHNLYSGHLFMIKAINDESIHCWKDRLYVLTHGKLLLFSSSNDPNQQPLSSIPIHNCQGKFDPSASSWILEISGKGLDSNDTVQERTWFLQTESESTCREWLDHITVAKQPLHPNQPLSRLSLRQEPSIRTMEIQDPLLLQLVAEPLLLDLERFQIKEPADDFFYSATATPVTPYLTSPAPSVSSNMSSYTQQQEYSKSAPQQQQRSALEWLPTANSAYLHVSNWGSSMTSSGSQVSSTRKDVAAKSGDFKGMSSKSLSSSPNQSTTTAAAEFGYRRKNSAPVSLDGTAGKKTAKKWRKLNSVTVDFDIL